MDFRKSGLALMEQGISDTICSMDLDLIPWEIMDDVEIFFQHLDQHIVNDIGFCKYEPGAISDHAVDLPTGILDFLDDLLLAADAQAHRLEGSKGYYA